MASSVESQSTGTDSDTATLTAHLSELEYGYTKNLGNFRSERLSIRLDAMPEDSPEDLLRVAKQWVNEHLQVTQDEVNSAHYDLDNAKRELESIRRKTDELAEVWDSLRKGLSKLGWLLPSDPEDLPF
jgi:chromosome segregation ATPase